MFWSVDGRLNHRLQGDRGELSAMSWLTEQGYCVWIPIGHSRDSDLIAERGEELLRVQVKTTTVWRDRRWDVMLCTRGGNRSWNGVVRRFGSSRCDRLFVHVGDGRRWWIPSTAVGGGSGIRLGGPKYAEFEVERGRPLTVTAAA